MPPRKRSRLAVASSSTAASADAIVLSGGHAEKPRTIESYRASQHVDVDICAADGTAFQAHRLVLMAGSDYFAAMWSGGWSDASGPITLGSVPADALGCCIEWIYTGTCSPETEKVLLAVLQAAAYLQIGPLMEAAVTTMVARVGPSNTLSIWHVAESHGIQALEEAAVTSACKHFSSVAASDEWLQVPATQARALLSDARLCVKSEEEVYHAAIAWLRARDPPADPTTAADLLTLVRFPLVSSAFVRDVVREEPLFATAPGRRLMADMFATLLDASRGLASPLTQRRGVHQVLYVAGGSDSPGGRLSSVERYDPSTSTWEAVAPMSTARYSAACAVLDGKLYVAGGMDSTSSRLSSVERYDPSTSTWEAVAPMSTARYGAACAVLDGKL